ncbi:TetR/AcrR family transcriptional regulator [Nocardioides terrisoli]|uniref:TetR/AcrR family transcriptional regulator n=1 Tax=Nocardioides terrisoli TaxID=3388267 RepID=UPI00287B6445|nr:TetR/AcrR family transcriptional regulator [Nocardioides marmorisolisilvae]
MAPEVKGLHGRSKDESEDDRSDGRSTRWDDHRDHRREQLVMAAISAIDEHGPATSVADIAAAAGVSKPVLYRYFTDKDDLYRSVGRWGAAEVLRALRPTLASDRSIREKVEQGAEDYLALIAEHPQVFLLLVEHRTADDPLVDGKEMLTAAFARSMGNALRALGADTGAAEPWAHGVVGQGLAIGEWWLRRRTMSQSVVASHLASFIWHSFSGMATDYGVTLEPADA